VVAVYAPRRLRGPDAGVRLHLATRARPILESAAQCWWSTHSLLDRRGQSAARHAAGSRGARAAVNFTQIELGDSQHSRVKYKCCEYSLNAKFISYHIIILQLCHVLLARTVVLDALRGALPRVVQQQTLFFLARTQHLAQVRRDVLQGPLGAALEQLFEAQSGGNRHESHCLIW
jgi:hypothetical protein